MRKKILGILEKLKMLNQMVEEQKLFPNGSKYIGGFKDGKRNGQGTYTFPNRTKGIGYFRINKPWNVTKYDKELNILGKYVNGKWIKNY